MSTGQRVKGDVEICEAAHEAALQIKAHGYATVEVSPGDMTVYRFLVADPRKNGVDTRNYWVAVVNTFGMGYFWSPETGSLDSYYAAQKWDHSSNHRTGEVVATFLNALGRELRDEGVA